MEIMDDVLIPVELKYCERCGGLWFRENEDEGIYCPGCAPEMAVLPPPKRRRVLVVAVNSIEELEGRIAELTAYCSEGGNA